MYGFVRWLILISQPILLILIIRYMQKPNEYDKGLVYGLSLVITYNIVDIISNLITDQSDFVQSIVGINARHGITGMIYDKALKISQSTNKRFSHGEIINFINIDVEKIKSISSNLSNAVKLPFQLIFGLGFLFYYFTFLLSASMIFGILFILINLLIGLIRGILQRKIFYHKDKRMSITNEVINSIKTIKLNSLANIFIDKIRTLRNKELYFTKLSLVIETILFSIGWIFSGWMSISVFLLHYLAGNNTTLAEGAAALQVFKSLEVPLRWVPQFTSNVVEFNVSMRRIHRFLIWKEMNPEIISIKDKNLLDKNEVCIENANFTWGGPKKEANTNRKDLKGKLICCNFCVICIFVSVIYLTVIREFLIQNKKLLCFSYIVHFYR